MTSDLRIHAPANARPRPDGEFVLYWMQGVTLRAHHNPALNFAVEQANALGLPVLVYHGLRHDYPWASDRLHTFILESVADLQTDFEARGMQYEFYLDPRTREEGKGKREEGKGRGRGGAVCPFPLPLSPLVALASRAALIVTDYFPTFIMPRQTRRLGEMVEAPVIAVDSCTVVPVRYLDKAYSSARHIRPVLLEALPHFLKPVGDVEPVVRRRIEVPFETVVVGNGIRQERGNGEKGPGRPGPVPHSPFPVPDSSIPDIIARLPIDHSVPPSPLFRGGARAAAARLARFLEHGLPRYEERSDPNVDVTSGLSPYLHFGNISIQEVLLRAREAGPQAQYDKFQDEALTWRELAHNFVRFDPKHRTTAAIPEWARKELDEHLTDPRPALYTAEQLERAETGDELWNAAQRSYLRDGYMHNYLRMLWGKAVLQWTQHYGEALEILEHLNNKYSLDGRDPNSYAGIHWIFGKFDRPFYRRPIYGTVRYMSLKAAKGKFDVEAFVGRYGK
jgi:deoxyribodipyrimidine photo-lyase